MIVQTKVLCVLCNKSAWLTSKLPVYMNFCLLGCGVLPLRPFFKIAGISLIPDVTMFCCMSISGVERHSVLGFYLISTEIKSA